MGRRQSAYVNDKADCSNGFELEEIERTDVEPKIKGFKIKTPKTVYTGWWQQPQITDQHKERLVQ